MTVDNIPVKTKGIPSDFCTRIKNGEIDINILKDDDIIAAISSDYECFGMLSEEKASQKENIQTAAASYYNKIVNSAKNDLKNPQRINRENTLTDLIYVMGDVPSENSKFLATIDSETNGNFVSKCIYNDKDNIYICFSGSFVNVSAPRERSLDPSNNMIDLTNKTIELERSKSLNISR